MISEYTQELIWHCQDLIRQRDSLREWIRKRNPESVGDILKRVMNKLNKEEI